MAETRERKSLTDVRVVVPEVDASDSDAKAALQQEREALRERHQEDIEDRKSAREQRKRYARGVFVLVCCWITAIFILLLFQVLGATFIRGFQGLSDKVLLALITSTTIDLIGTLIIVLRYIFHVTDPK